MKNIGNKQLLYVTLFAIAMGMLESAVVIFLRELYYPQGFTFPLHAMNLVVSKTEILREFATIVMLATFSILIGKSSIERFAWFLYSFAIWDIFYYVFLYILIGWPVSLFDWDVLFLLPTMWVGPVWAPVTIAFYMIFLACSILYFDKQNSNAQLHMNEAIICIIGSIILIVGFCKDFYGYMTTTFPTIECKELFFSENTFSYAINYIPRSFDYTFFGIGITLYSIAIILYIKRNRKNM